MFPLTWLQLGIYIIRLTWGVHAAPPVMFFADDERQQFAVLVLPVTERPHRKPAQLAVL